MQKRRSRSDALSCKLARSNLQGNVTIFYLLFSANTAAQVSTYRNPCEQKSLCAKRNLALGKFRPAEFLQQPRSTDFLVKVFVRRIARVVKVRATIHDDSCVSEDASRGWRLVDGPEVARRRAERARFFFSRARA